MTDDTRPQESRTTGEKSAVAEGQRRVDNMLAEFRAAQQRRLVKQGVALWNDAEAAYRAVHARRDHPRPCGADEIHDRRTRDRGRPSCSEPADDRTEAPPSMSPVSREEPR